MKSRIRGVLEHAYKSIKRKTILYIGVAEYSNDVKILEENNDVITIDKDLRKINNGAKKHYCRDITEALDFPDNYFDYVFMLGVYGYGMNTKEEFFKAFENIKNVMKDKGTLFMTFTKKEETKK